MHTHLSKTRFWITIMFPYAMGYFISTAFRSLNAVLAFPIMKTLDLNNLQIGWVTSFYVLAFALAQIPLGVLLDHWGPRKTQTLFFFIGGIGILIFATAPSVIVLSIGRALLGIGMAGGLMAAFKAISEWVGGERIPFLNGVILTAGGIGALSATTPSKLFEVQYGWRSLCIVLGILTFLIALLILFLSRDKHLDGKEDWNLWHQVLALKTIYSEPFFWQIVPLFALSLGGFIGMQGLWLGPWLSKVVGFNSLQSANYLLVIAIGMTFGLLSGGIFSSLAKKLKVPLHIFIAWGIGVHIATQVVIVGGWFSSSYVMWFVYSYFAQMALVNYASITHHFGPKLNGRAITAANILIFLVAFAVQVLFGIIVHYWPKNLEGAHSSLAYQVAFSLLIITEIIAFVWFMIAGRMSRS